MFNAPCECDCYFCFRVTSGPCESLRGNRRISADRREKKSRPFLGRRRAKNPRSVKIWQKNRKLLVKRKLLRRVSLGRARATSKNHRRAAGEGGGRSKTIKKGRKRTTRGFWAAKAQKSLNDRFYICSPMRSCDRLCRRRPNRQFAEHENQRRPSSSFTRVPSACP